MAEYSRWEAWRVTMQVATIILRAIRHKVGDYKNREIEYRVLIV